MPGRPLRSPQVEAMLRELGELWEDLQRKHQENGAVLREIDKVCGGRAGVDTGARPSLLGIGKQGWCPQGWELQRWH